MVQIIPDLNISKISEEQVKSTPSFGLGWEFDNMNDMMLNQKVCQTLAAFFMWFQTYKVVKFAGNTYKI